MNPVLTEIFSGPWLISPERSAAYASILLSLIKGERFSENDSSIARERNRSYVIGGAGDMEKRFGFSEPNIPEGSVAVIPIRSEILKYDQPCGPRGTQSLLNDVKAAGQNPNISGILLVVDSPGGQVAGTDLLAEAIGNAPIPVVAFIDGLAASAAYWIISGADKIIASSELDRIGSIGTMMLVEDVQPALEQSGVKFHEVYASLSTDKNKDFNQVLEGNYDQYRQNVLDVINTKFLSTVKSYRANLDDSTLTGKIFFALQAIELGLVDRIGTFGQAMEEVVSLARDMKGQSIEHETKTQQTMKMKTTWKAIQNFFKMEPVGLESQELTDEQLQQVNDQLALVTLDNERLEQELAREKEAHSVTLSELKMLQGDDAVSETVAAKDADKFPNEGAGTVIYAHDKIADEFCAKQ